MRRGCSPFLLTLGLATFLECGCSSKKIQMSGVYPVRGSVRVNGEPAEYANVVLVPADSNSQVRKAFGSVDKEGSFKLSTERQFDGAEPGEYFVTVSWSKPKNPKISESDDGPELLPAKYQDPQKSGLKVVIEPHDNQLQPFELTK